MTKSKLTAKRVGKSREKAAGKGTEARSARSERVEPGSKTTKEKHGGTVKDRGAKRPKAHSPADDDVLVGTRFLSSDGLVDVDRVAQSFGMTKASLAQSLGFADDTLQRFSRVTAPKTQQRLREMIEILTRVERWAGGMPQALGWYRGQGIPALGDQTAEALVKCDQAVIVRRYLDGLAAGGFA